MSTIILGIESSCDDTSAAVLDDGVLLSNVIASQAVHEAYGGVVPELASRAHQQNIVPVVSEAIRRAGLRPSDLSAIAFTRGPGLMGSLLVGLSFAKGLAAALDVPMIDVNHLQGHVMAHFVRECVMSDAQGRPTDDRRAAVRPWRDAEGRLSVIPKDVPPMPFLCLLVSGGNSQIIRVKAYGDMEVIGQTIDDAAGEAFDKCAKVMGLGYPGGPVIDRLAHEGDPHRFRFARPHIPGLDYSFSGLKTSFLYTLRDALRDDPDFIGRNKADLCASLQQTIVDILMDKLQKAVAQTGLRHVAIAGGVSANSGVREALTALGQRHGWHVYLPKLSFTTDNAAMIAMVGHCKYLDHQYCPYTAPAFARVTDTIKD